MRVPRPYWMVGCLLGVILTPVLSPASRGTTRRVLIATAHPDDRFDREQPIGYEGSLVFRILATWVIATPFERLRITRAP